MGHEWTNFRPHDSDTSKFYKSDRLLKSYFPRHSNPIIVYTPSMDIQMSWCRQLGKSCLVDLLKVTSSQCFDWPKKTVFPEKSDTRFLKMQSTLALVLSRYFIKMTWVFYNFSFFSMPPTMRQKCRQCCLSFASRVSSSLPPPSTKCTILPWAQSLKTIQI